MFKNIIDLVIGLPDFINNLLKMKDKIKKQNIGRDVCALEYNIYNLKKNAILVKEELEKLIQQINDGEKWCLYNLCSLLRSQHIFISQIRDILYNGNLGNSIFRIYGYNCDLLKNLVDGKADLVDMIEDSISTGFSDESLPKTFDLDDYAIVHSLVDREGHKHTIKDYGRFLFRRLNEKGETKFISKKGYKVVNHLIFLHGQVEKFDSVNKLNEAHSKIAEMIKSNFKIEEIVSESID